VSADRCELLGLDLVKAESVRARLPSEDAVRPAAEAAKALSDATRFIVASALAATDELCVCDLAWVTGRAENLVSHHARQLRNAGLASSRREGKMVLYSLTSRGRALLEALVEPGARGPQPGASLSIPSRMSSSPNANSAS
jgi:DNA-binding transcriptional ArsR family regulator